MKWRTDVEDVGGNKGTKQMMEMIGRNNLTTMGPSVSEVVLMTAFCQQRWKEI